MSASIERLTDGEIEAARRELPDWSIDGGRLRREFRFADFASAFAFMTKVAELAEQANHHPDWRNSWNRVWIELTTHDAAGLTVRDVELARAIDRIQ